MSRDDVTVTPEEMAQAIENAQTAVFRDPPWSPNARAFLALLADRDALRAELERTKEELENARNALEEAVRVITSDNPAICDTIWTGRPGETLLDHLQAALERKDGA